MGHPGVQRVVKEVSRKFAFPPALKLYEAVREVCRGCVTCQACDPKLEQEFADLPCPGARSNNDEWPWTFLICRV